MFRDALGYSPLEDAWQRLRCLLNLSHEHRDVCPRNHHRNEHR